MMEPDWNACPDVERNPARMSGAWTIKGIGGRPTRIRVEDILANAEDQTPEQIVTEVYEGLDIEPVRRVIAFARKGVHAAAVGS
jgi:uncharacterized protein (DUF433 family)